VQCYSLLPLASLSVLLVIATVSVLATPLNRFVRSAISASTASTSAWDGTKWSDLSLCALFLAADY
jgi:hypothetical protein